MNPEQQKIVDQYTANWFPDGEQGSPWIHKSDIEDICEAVLAVPNEAEGEIGFEWTTENVLTESMEMCTVNGARIGWIEKSKSQYMTITGELNHKPSIPEARAAVQDAFKAWLGGVRR